MRKELVILHHVFQTLIGLRVRAPRVRDPLLRPPSLKTDIRTDFSFTFFTAAAGPRNSDYRRSFEVAFNGKTFGVDINDVRTTRPAHLLGRCPGSVRRIRAPLANLSCLLACRRPIRILKRHYTVYIAARFRMHSFHQAIPSENRTK